MVVFESLKLVLLFLFFETHSVSADLDTIEVNRTRMLLVHGPKHENNTAYSLYEADELGENLSHRYTAMFIPDYYVPQYTTTYHPMDEAFHKNGDYDYIELDWGFTTDDPSKVKQPDVEALKKLIAQFIIKLLNHVDRKNFHLIAYSVGVELASNVTREIIAETDGQMKLARYTLLDPPPNDIIMKKRQMGLNNNYSADFTDSIHTDAYGQGTTVPVGHASFWPNRGKTQPGCNPQTDKGPRACSHERAFVYFAESVANQKTGPAFSCYSATRFSDFTPKRFMDPEMMGLSCSSKARGNYYLLTNASPPYAIGRSKAIYNYN